MGDGGKSITTDDLSGAEGEAARKAINPGSVLRQQPFRGMA
jgi:hypothetical protein